MNSQKNEGKQDKVSGRFLVVILLVAVSAIAVFMLRNKDASEGIRIHEGLWKMANKMP
ncbi:MAG: hypothetical protein WCO10_02915 [bacterium]